MRHSLYMDVHVPIAITSWLRQRPFDVLTCADELKQRLQDIAAIISPTESRQSL